MQNDLAKTKHRIFTGRSANFQIFKKLIFDPFHIYEIYLPLAIAAVQDPLDLLGMVAHPLPTPPSRQMDGPNIPLERNGDGASTNNKFYGFLTPSMLRNDSKAIKLAADLLSWYLIGVF